MLINPPDCYYSFSTFGRYDRTDHWCVIYKGGPICFTTTFEGAHNVAKQFGLVPSEYYWNGDMGQFMLIVNIEEISS